MRPLEFEKIVFYDGRHNPHVELNLLRCFDDFSSPQLENSDSSDDQGQTDKKATGKNPDFDSKNGSKESRTSLSLGDHQDTHKQEKALDVHYSTATSSTHAPMHGTKERALGLHSHPMMVHRPSSHRGTSPIFPRLLLANGYGGWSVIRRPAPVTLNQQTTVLPPPQYLVPPGDGRFQPLVVPGFSTDGTQLPMPGGFFSPYYLGLGSMASVSASSSCVNPHEGNSLELDLSLKL